MKTNNKNTGTPEQPADPLNPATMTVPEIITRCGALRYSLTQIVALLRPRTSPAEINRLILALRTPGSEEYNAYETGMTTADFRLQTLLLDHAGTDKDSYEAFSAEQRRQAINAALADKFGLSEEKQ